MQWRDRHRRLRHHPTEIRATLVAICEKYQPERLFCVFQPHQHSRTRFLLDDFARASRRPRKQSCRTSTSSATAKPNGNGSPAASWSNGSSTTAGCDAYRQAGRHPAYLRGKLREGDVVVTMEPETCGKLRESLWVRKAKRMKNVKHAM